MDEVNLTTHSEEETMAFGEWSRVGGCISCFAAAGKYYCPYRKNQ